MPVASQRYDVRMAKPAVEALQDLPREQATAVARAVRLIGTTEGVPLQLPGQDQEHYLVIVPDDDHAPVVVYRQRPKVEGGGYLVTGLLDRDAYNAYAHAGEPGFFDTAAGKAVLGIAAPAAAAIGIAMSSRSGKGTPTQ